MDKLAALLAVVALGGVAWMAFGQDNQDTDLADQIELLRADIAAQGRRIDQLQSSRAPTLLSADTGARNAPILRGDGPNGGTPGADTTSLSVDERVARLEELVRAQDDRIEKVASKSSSGAFRPFRSGRFFRSADDAAKALGLDESGKADMERILEAAKHEMARLHDTPNEEGKSFSELQREMRDALMSPGNSEDKTNSILSHVRKSAAFRSGTVPGTNETYAQAERRIHKRAMDDIRRNLTPEQQTTWDRSHTVGLLPGGGNQITSTMVVSEPGEGVFVGGSIETEIPEEK